MADFIDINLNVDDEPIINNQIRRRCSVILNPLQHFDTPSINPFRRELYRRYRFDRPSILYLTDLFRQQLSADSMRNRSVPPEIQICVALRYYASGSFQQVLADTVNIDQSTVSRIVTKMTNLLAQKVNDFIKFSSGVQAQTNSSIFFTKSNRKLPSIVGCIDCTHVRIIAPVHFKQNFINRKNQYSINVQVVCDCFGKIINIIASWPGSAHDSWILSQSDLYQHFENGNLNGILLGDSGYPLKSWLLTPYLYPENNAQEEYNYAERRIRVAVENTLSRWKRRFNLLHQEIRKTPERACKEIVACAVLHNIAVDRNLPLLREWPAADPNNDIDAIPHQHAHDLPQRTRRDAIVEQYFT